jgi:Tfp pilus assembly protein PilW
MQEVTELIFKTYGLVGLFLIAPVVGLVYLWRRNNKLDADMSRIQESRVSDAKAVSDKLMEIVIEQAGLNKETNIALDQVRELLSKITTTTRRPQLPPGQG